MLKKGLAVYREGWNGKGMFIYLVPASEYPTVADIAKVEFGEKVKYTAYIAMKTVSGEVTPWLASQSDLLSEDWLIR